MIGHAYDGLPDEACGLLAGPIGSDRITAFYPCRNAAASSKLYAIEYPEIEAADTDAASRGLDLKGTMHSHTHTDAYPSATDVRQAVDPNWWYVIVGLRHGEPDVRAWLIADGAVREESIEVPPGGPVR
jgi:proteasome lid subunit RPN8/RPN11